jgi:hypothetical protein
MGRTREDQLLSVVNASGFPFQIRVAHLVRETAARRGWTVLVSEHPWTDEETGENGFIDVVLGRDDDYSLRLVIECKRAKDSQWVFISPDTTAKSFELVRCFVTLNSRGDKAGTWADCEFAPASAESSFCSVRGDGSSRTSLLERLSADVCSATEAFGRQELRIEASTSLPITTLYVPVIVTNVELFECRVKPSAVNLDSGSVELDDVDFRATPFIRFRKPLTARHDLSGSSDIQTVNQDAERTVLVLSAHDLSESLERLRPIRILPDSPRSRYVARSPHGGS